MQLKGSNSSGSNRTKRPYEFKVEALRLRDEGKSPAEALKQAATTFGLDLTKSMEKFPASVLDGYKKAVEKKLEKSDPSVEELVEDANLNEVEADEVEVVGDSDD